MQLCPELGVGVGFAPDNGAHSGLDQTDDPLGDAVGPMFKNKALLFVSCSHHIHAVFLCFGQFHAVLYEPDDLSHIPPGTLAVCPWLFSPVLLQISSTVCSSFSRA